MVSAQRSASDEDDGNDRAAIRVVPDAVAKVGVEAGENDDDEEEAAIHGCRWNTGGVHVSNTRRRLALSDDDDESARAVSNATKHADSRETFNGDNAADARHEIGDAREDVPVEEAAALGLADSCAARIDGGTRALESAAASRNAAGIDCSAVNEAPTTESSVGTAAVSVDAPPIADSVEDDVRASIRVSWRSTRPSPCKTSTSNTQ